MFKKMRRSEFEVDKKKSLEILTNGVYGVIGTIGENGYPSVTPFCHVVEDETIFIHCSNKTGSFLSSIKNNDQVAFTLVSKYRLNPADFVIDYTSVMVHGKAKIVSNNSEKIRILKLFLNKYSKSFMEKGIEHIHEDLSNTAIVGIKIEHITGKSRFK